VRTVAVNAKDSSSSGDVRTANPQTKNRHSRAGGNP